MTGRRVHFGPLVLPDLRALSPDQRHHIRRAVPWLARHPEEDGLSKRPAPFSSIPGAMIAIHGPLVIHYRLSEEEDDDEIVIVRVLGLPP